MYRFLDHLHHHRVPVDGTRRKRAARGIAPGPHAPEAIVTPRYQSANDKFDNQRQLKFCVSITKIKISEATTTSNTVVFLPLASSLLVLLMPPMPAFGHEMTRPGLEPGISGSGGRWLIHSANSPRFCQKARKKRPDEERKNGGKVEIRGFDKFGKTPNHRQNRGIFGPGGNLKNTVWPKIGENGPTASPKMGLKSKIVF